MERKKPGALVISLDFELFWGMFDKHTLASYGARIKGERTAIPRMLALFERYGIHATWATVGMLMARNRSELEKHLPPPNLQPRYTDMRISAYEHLTSDVVGSDESSDPYHYGPDLVAQIQKTPHQIIGNHTFSHFYCVDGHTNDPGIFAADLAAWARIAETYGITATSLVFPRNQWSPEALTIARTHGITVFRGNEDHLLYRARGDKEQTLLIRAIRLLDHYINLSGYHTYARPSASDNEIVNVPASRFMRPWNKHLRWFEPLRIRRITRAMTHAAKQGEVFHLWWHPHNVGIDQEENFANLERVLSHFKDLRTQYGMESLTMEELATANDARDAQATLAA
jgi:peptidoglycan/xylan/chitin deacetylase (PgdA/CDA1 family)